MNAKADHCPSSQILAKFGIGNLDPARAETISQHLETCVECRGVVEKVPPDSFIGLVLEAHGYSASAVSSATVPPASAAVSFGDLIPPASLLDRGDYEIIRPLGRGGMGVVYLARNRVLDRLEVLKAVSKSLLDRPGVIERFQREIRAAARLHHPNVVAVYSAPRFGEQLTLAMEFVDGENLARVVLERGPLPVVDATCYAHQTALGLQHAHDRGMVHRDIKPGNLMLAREDQQQIVKILDFGLAKVTSEEAQRKDGLTQTGQILGTPDYIAPEQTLDAPHADIRADIYSLGCTLYHLLAGRPPFQAESLYAVMHAHHHVAALPLDRVRPDVPAELAAVVAKMMAKDPAARFQSPGDVALALVPFFEPGSHTPRSPRADAAIAPSDRFTLSRPTKTALLAMLVAGVAALAIVQFRSKTEVELSDSLADASRPTILVSDRDAPPLAIAPFDEVQARAHQEAWAKHLGTLVEQTNSLGMKLVLIPPGEFMMGSTQEEIEMMVETITAEQPSLKKDRSLRRYSPEVPKHRVTISRPFLMAATELTIGQFRKFVDATKFVTEAEQDGGGVRFDYEGKGDWILHDPNTTWRHPWYRATDEFPVTVVSWNDAVQFCNWLSKEENLKPCYTADAANGWILSPEGNGYRLPTEAQWEFACRAGTPTQFSFGDDARQMDRHGWCWPSSLKTAHPVAEKLPNPFGLHDMHGNVAEWCHDWYFHSDYNAAPQIDPQGPAPGAGPHLYRGGDWYSPWDFARSSFRRVMRESNHYIFTNGFRVARVAKMKAGAEMASSGFDERQLPSAAPSPIEDARVDAPRPAILVPDRDSPPLAIAPFDAKQARAHQEAWAKHLDMPVEQTNSLGMPLVLVPPGEFMMGSTEEEIEAVAKSISAEIPSVSYSQSLKRCRTEVPKHRVAISRPVLFAATELTVGQFRKFADATGFATDAERGGGGSRVDYEGKGAWIDHDPGTTWRHPWYPATEEFPVSVVSWNDAVQFCNWLSIEEHLRPCYQPHATDGWILSPDGNGYRLPTEAEWEFACRAGTTTQFSFGDDPKQLGRHDWYWPVIVRTAQPVAKKLPNPFGLYDIHGNVSELCHDRYSEGYYDVSPPMDPQGPAGGDERRSNRGGDWNFSWDMARSSFRRASRGRSGSVFTVGFRVARVVPMTLGAGKTNGGGSRQIISSAAPSPIEEARVNAQQPVLLVPDRDSPPLAVAPFDARQAHAHQEAWARHLGVPVEQTNSLGMKLILIPPGVFAMGSTPEEIEKGAKLAREQEISPDVVAMLERVTHEAPEHRVRLTRPFQLGGTEVTVGQFRQFVEAAKYVTDAERFGGARAMVSDPTAAQGWKWLESKPGATWITAYESAPLNEQWPISVVSWNDAVAFCNWLSEKETLSPCYQREGEKGWTPISDGAGYRLPTEAEWEYACRAGTTTLFCSGDDLAGVDRLSWNFRHPLLPDSLLSPQPVRTKLPNAFGLFDMHGNVWEWCQDLYSDGYYSYSPGVDPRGPPSGPHYIHRGGCWHQSATFCRSAARSHQAANYRSQLIGFRVARGLTIISTSK